MRFLCPHPHGLWLLPSSWDRWAEVFRGVLPLPISALRSASPVLSNPADRHKAIPLTFEQFHYAFANAVDEAEAQKLYDE